MPDYETHLLAGSLFALIATIVSWDFFAPIAEFQTAVLAAIWAGMGVVIGAIIPDIDLHNSKPRVLLNWTLCLAIAAGVGVYSVGGTEVVASGSEKVIFPAVVVGFVTLILSSRIVPNVVQAVMPGHRGYIHNPLFWLLVAGVPGYLLFAGDLSTGISQTVDLTIFGPTLMCVFIGSLIHIVMDVFLTEPIRRTRGWA